MTPKDKKFCERCRKEVVGHLACFPPLVEKGMHPKCLVEMMRENPDKLEGRIPLDLLESPDILQAMLEQITEDPTRGRPVTEDDLQ